MLTEICVFVWEIAIIAMETFQSDLSGRTGTVQVKSGMSIDSHLERCLLHRKSLTKFRTRYTIVLTPISSLDSGTYRPCKITPMWDR